MLRQKERGVQNEPITKNRDSFSLLNFPTWDKRYNKTKNIW